MAAEGRRLVAHQVALGFRAGRGGSVVVGVTGADAPRVVLSTFLATAAAGDRLAFEPFHVAAEMAQGSDGDVPANVAAAVDEALGRQADAAQRGLSAILQRVRDGGGEPVVGALLVNRAAWVTDLLPYSLSMPDHPPVAEGLAVRDSLRTAFQRCDLRWSEVDEKSLPDVASAALGLTMPALTERMTSLGKAAGRPWRKEQKNACLAAWLALPR